MGNRSLTGEYFPGLFDDNNNQSAICSGKNTSKMANYNNTCKGCASKHKDLSDYVENHLVPQDCNLVADIHDQLQRIDHVWLELGCENAYDPTVYLNLEILIAVVLSSPLVFYFTLYYVGSRANLREGLKGGEENIKHASSWSDSDSASQSPTGQNSLSSGIGSNTSVQTNPI